MIDCRSPGSPTSAGASAGAAGCWPCISDSIRLRGAVPRTVRSESVKQITRNAPPSHLVAVCRNVAVCRLPIISMPVPAPPKPAARPPPLPAWSSTATTSAKQSIRSSMRRIVYIAAKEFTAAARSVNLEERSGGPATERSLESAAGRGHDRREPARVEARSADQGAVDVRLTKEFSGVLRLDAPAVQDPRRLRRRRRAQGG